MATTTNFGWQTPDDTDLVKDGAAAIRTLGSSIDTSLVDLKGGTTGQILAKTSNTDMDFTWVANDVGDITEVTVSSPLTGGGSSGSVNVAIQDGTTAQKGAVQLEDSTSSTSTTKAATPNSVKSAYDLADAAVPESIFAAKGDLLSATANDTPAILAVGNNGETLVADSAATTGLRWQGNYAAGKNKIINGDFNIWQRGTSFSVTSAAVIFTSDRWSSYNNGNGTITVSRQAFTAGSAPVAGYESEYFARINVASAGTSTDWLFRQPIEDVRTLANQTATVSFYAKASASQTLKAQLQQVFGSGGSGTVSTTVINSQTLTASWVRYSASVSLPSISGKTIGAGNHLLLQFSVGTGGIATGDIDIWGVQVEVGSVATAFQTATGTLQGELAACQRYYFRNTVDQVYGVTAAGFATSTTNVLIFLQLPVQMRVTPTAVEYANLRLLDSGFAGSLTSITISANECSKNVALLTGTGTGYTAHRGTYLSGNNNAAAYVAVTAEL